MVFSKDEFTDDSNSVQSKRSFSSRLAVACAIGTAAASLVCILTPFVSPGFRKMCLPYVPATTKQLSYVAQLLRHAEVHERRHIGSLLDIGSGDGRVVSLLLTHPPKLTSWLMERS